jgi:hypothetical protein
MENSIRIGDTVAYNCVCGTIYVIVLSIKQDGKLILNTRKKHKLLKPLKNGQEYVSLIKNVCVLPHRVKKIF